VKSTIATETTLKLPRSRKAIAPTARPKGRQTSVRCPFDAHSMRAAHLANREKKPNYRSHLNLVASFVSALDFSRMYNILAMQRTPLGGGSVAPVAMAARERSRWSQACAMSD
jgi:hypothetical protein